MKDLSRAAERELEQLQRQLASAEACGDYEEIREIEKYIRDIERESADYDRWREEGEERDWY